MTQIIKLILVVLLLLCLADMPYGYYQFVRFAAMMSFVWMAWEAMQKKNETEVFLYVGLAILFQPLVKIALGRTMWNVVDVGVAWFLIGSLLMRIPKKPESQ